MKISAILIFILKKIIGNFVDIFVQYFIKAHNEKQLRETERENITYNYFINCHQKNGNNLIGFEQLWDVIV